MSQFFDAKYIRKFNFLQLTDLFAIGVWKDMQDEEIQDELKRYVTLCYVARPCSRLKSKKHIQKLHV